MKFSHAYLLIDKTNEGVVKQARLVYDTDGGQVAHAFPVGKQAPANTESATWDDATLTMSYHLDDETTVDAVLTEQEIEDAKLTPAL